MKKISGRGSLFYVILGLVLIGLDQVFKYTAKHLLSFESAKPLVGDLLYLQLHYNRGFAFGLGSSHQLLLLAVIITLIGFFMYLFFKHQDYRLAFFFVIVGAVGNLIDRVVYFPLGVLDYIGIRYFSIFNMADVLITLGGVLLFVKLLYEIIEERRNSKYKRKK